ncbi:MAG: hypothetical protein RIC95_10440 [Vicingaceae bacterium]
MSKKNLQSYFAKARELPLTSDYAMVEKLVRQKGVTSVSPKKWWWNLNTLILMTTLTTTMLLAAFYWLGNPAESHYIATKIEPIAPLQFDKGPLMIDVIITEPEKEEAAPESIEMKSMPAKTWQYEPLWKEADEPIPMPEMEIVALEETQTNSNEAFEIDTSNLSENQKVIKSVLASEGVSWFELQNTRGDIRIHKSSASTIQLQALVEVKTKKKDQESAALADFQIELKKKGDRVMVESNWEDVFSCMCTSNSKKDYIKTAEGEKIKIDELNISYDIYLPDDIHLDLKNSYADIEIPDWSANLKVRLFHADLHGGSVRKLVLSNSYGKAFLGDFKEASGKLFKAELVLKNGEKLDLKANYSTLNLGQLSEVELNAFQSDAEFQAIHQKLTSNFRYGKLKVGKSVDNVNIKAFQAKLYFDVINQADVNLSYSRLEVNQLNSLNSENAFQSNIDLGAIKEFRGNLKYSPLKIEQLDNVFELTSFQGKVKIDKLSASFQNIDMTCKYTDLDIGIEAKGGYKLNLESNYASLDLPEMSQVSTESSHSRKNIQSVYDPEQKGEDLPQIAVNMFQGSLNLKNN